MPDEKKNSGAVCRGRQAVPLFFTVGFLTGRKRARPDTRGSPRAGQRYGCSRTRSRRNRSRQRFHAAPPGGPPYPHTGGGRFRHLRRTRILPDAFRRSRYPASGSRSSNSSMNGSGGDAGSSRSRRGPPPAPGLWRTGDQNTRFFTSLTVQAMRRSCLWFLVFCRCLDRPDGARVQ